MTVQKHLKSRIRTRMQKTGESYTTARRHILNQQPTNSSTILHPLLRWHLPGHIPTTTALRILVSHAGVRNPFTEEPFSEALLFVLSGGIGMGVFTFFYEKEDFASFFIGGRHSWFDDLAYSRETMERFRLQPIIQESTSKKSADKQLRNTLAKGNPCIAWVDMAMLPHRAMPTAFQGGGYHVVTAYKIEGDQVIIGDLTDEPITISMQDFSTARERIKKQKNRLLSIEPFTGKLDLAKLVHEGLKSCARGLVEAKMGSVTTNFRLDALKQWADRLHESKDKDRWERIFASPGNFWRALTSLYDFVECYGTGGGLCRPIFADGLTEAADLLRDPKLHELAKIYRELGRQWTSLAETALPRDVPMFAQARELIAQRAEFLHVGEPAESIRNIWTQLEVLEEQAKKQFPLSPTEIYSLRKSLQKRVRALYEGELAAQQLLTSL